MVKFRNLQKLAEKAKDTVDKRGGTDSLKQDMDELKGIAKSKGSITDKAKAAGKAVKDPGAPGGEAHPGAPGEAHPGAPGEGSHGERPPGEGR
jgi:hypothetical protein